MRRALLAAVVAVLGAAFAVLVDPARAQGPSASARPWASSPSTPHGPTAPVALPAPGSLLGHFGTDAAMRLMRSSDADERLRGIERAAATHTPEALALLERATRASLAGGGLDPRMPAEGIARTDPRALLAAVRGIAAWDDEKARAALLAIVAAPADFFATHGTPAASDDPAADDAEGAERVRLAREEAASAVAGAGGEIALESLVAIARSGGAGQPAALKALAIHPPAGPLPLGGVALTTPPLLTLATRVADLRSLDLIMGAVRASDPALRAAAITALGDAGDTRGVEIARAATHDVDPRVRIAAARGLVRLGAPDAEPAVEALIADDATVLEALALGQDVQGEGIAKGAAARVAASADEAIRAAAIATLGRQASEAAVQALTTFLADPLLEGDAAFALARSPSPAALRAIEGVASRRLSARAYFVRRFVRGDRSAALDARLASLAASGDPRDRSVGVQALVTLGERPLEGALADPDARVRRAAVLGAMGRWSSQSSRSSMRALLARAVTESDEPTRRLLAVGLMDGDAHPAAPSSELLARARGGGPDAPLATLALARRDDDRWKPRVDELLNARDPLLRAHAARGLGANRAADATGRLARAYAWEADASVRRAIVGALAKHAKAGAPAADAGVLGLAARLDPDAETRAVAGAALAGSYRGEGRGARTIPEIAWVRLVPAEGVAATGNAMGDAPPEGMLIESDGLAVPIVFDDDGYALVAGVPPGEAVLRLAPRLPSYSAPGP